MGALVSQGVAAAATVRLISYVVIQGYDSLAVGLAMSAIEDIIEFAQIAQINGGDNDVMQCPGNATSIADPVSGSPSVISYKALRCTKRKRSAAILELQLIKLNSLGVEDKVGGEVSGREGFNAMTTNDDDALKRTILAVLRDVTLAEEQDLISTADEREDSITGVDGGQGLVDEEKLKDGEKLEDGEFDRMKLDVVRSAASASVGSSGPAVMSPAKLRCIILDGSNIAMA